MINTRTFIGYHGTTKSACKKICNGSYKISKRNNHWLGDGVYFFLEDINEAKRWIENDPRFSCCSHVVITNKITFDRNKCLFLDTSIDRDYVEKIYKQARKRIKEENIAFSINDNNENRCLILNLIPKETIEVIIGSFPRDSKKKKEKEDDVFTLAFDLRQMQMCVRKPELITIIKYEELKNDEKNRNITA